LGKRGIIPIFTPWGCIIDHGAYRPAISKMAQKDFRKLLKICKEENF
jgi:hypothetical protein